MAGKPITLPTWDSNSTNLTAPTAGHKTDGFAVNEVPTSAEMNGQLNLLGQWAAFLSAFATNAGSAQGSLDIGNTAEANLVPLSASRDYLQNLRSLVDHNGYRMGQVTELDEVWNAAPVTINVPLMTAQPISGTWTNGAGDWTSASSIYDLRISLTSVVPAGAIITAVSAKVSRGATGDSTTVEIESLITNTPTHAVNKVVSSGTGVSTITLAAPTAGHLPYQPSNANDDTQISIFGTTTVSITVYSVQVTYVMPPPGWTFTGQTTNIVNATVGDQFAMVDPQSGLNQRGIKLIGATVAATTGIAQLTSNFETYIDLNTAFVMEFEVRTGTITDAANHRNFQLGIQASSTNFIGLYSDASLANWQLSTPAGFVASAVAIAANTVYRMRLEVYGANVSSGGNFKVRAYINGTKFAEVNTATIAADKYQPFFTASSIGTTGGPYDFTVGRLRRAWNHLATGDNL